MSERAEVLQVHHDFHQALNQGNMEVMKSLWKKDEEVIILAVSCLLCALSVTWAVNFPLCIAWTKECGYFL